MRSCYNCGGGISDHESFCGDNCESEYNDYIQSEAGDQSDNEAAAEALSSTIRREDIIASPQHGRFTGEFSYRVNHIDHPYHAGRTYSGYTEDEAIDAHHRYLTGEGDQ